MKFHIADPYAETRRLEPADLEELMVEFVSTNRRAILQAPVIALLILFGATHAGGSTGESITISLFTYFAALFNTWRPKLATLGMCAFVITAFVSIVPDLPQRVYSLVFHPEQNSCR